MMKDSLAYPVACVLKYPISEEAIHLY